MALVHYTPTADEAFNSVEHTAVVIYFFRLTSVIFFIDYILYCVYYI